MGVVAVIIAMLYSVMVLGVGFWIGMVTAGDDLE